ncbi:MAG: Hpt domain-containing protein, partial [Methylococcus sp.]
MSAPDPFLLELFREEMAAHSAVLTEGLLSLERQGGSRERIEPLMRAAHSIKGAARVVDLEPIVRVAHAMEDVLVDAGAGKATLDAGVIDVLLGALDWMNGLGAVADGELCGWLREHGEEAADWVARVGADGGPALAAVAPPATEPVAEAGILSPAAAPLSPDTLAEALPAPADSPARPAAVEK